MAVLVGGLGSALLQSLGLMPLVGAPALTVDAWKESAFVGVRDQSPISTVNASPVGAEIPRRQPSLQAAGIAGRQHVDVGSAQGDSLSDGRVVGDAAVDEIAAVDLDGGRKPRGSRSWPGPPRRWAQTRAAPRHRSIDRSRRCGGESAPPRARRIQSLVPSGLAISADTVYGAESPANRVAPRQRFVAAGRSASAILKPQRRR